MGPSGFKSLKIFLKKVASPCLSADRGGRPRSDIQCGGRKNDGRENMETQDIGAIVLRPLRILCAGFLIASFVLEVFFSIYGLIHS